MRRSWMIGSVVLICLLALTALMPAATVAAPISRPSEIQGVATQCWMEWDVGHTVDHVNKNNEVYITTSYWKWVTLLEDGQVYTGYSTIHMAFNAKDNWTTYGMHNTGEWLLFPGRYYGHEPPVGVAGWYEGNEVARTVPSVPLEAPGFFIITATLNGKGTLQGQNLHVTMPFLSRTVDPNLCDGEGGEMNFDVMMRFTNTP